MLRIVAKYNISTQITWLRLNYQLLLEEKKSPVAEQFDYNMTETDDFNNFVLLSE